MIANAKSALWLALCLGVAACGVPEDEARTIYHDPELAAFVAQGTNTVSSEGPRPDRPQPAGDDSETPGADARPPNDGPAHNGTAENRALEIVVQADTLELGWSHEPLEVVTAWPPALSTPGDSIPALVKLATTYATRETTAAAERPGNAFDALARVRLEIGAVSTVDQLHSIVGSLTTAGFDRVSVAVGTSPLQVSVPLQPPAMEPPEGEHAGLSFARLRWKTSADGVWIDGDVSISGPLHTAGEVVDSRPDLAIGLRSAWSCALVEPEPTFVDAVRRASSALRTFALPEDLPVYVELAPGASFSDAWRLASEMKASGHARVSFLRRDHPGPLSSSCPGDARNAASLRAELATYLAQPREEGVRALTGLEYVAAK
jgi:hypothetical protein